MANDNVNPWHDGEVARQLGYRCHDCNGKALVYQIQEPMGDKLPAGSYCYPCLLKRCKDTKSIPYPLPVELLEKLKHDLGISPLAIPIKYQKVKRGKNATF